MAFLQDKRYMFNMGFLKFTSFFYSFFFFFCVQANTVLIQLTSQVTMSLFSALWHFFCSHFLPSGFKLVVLNGQKKKKQKQKNKGKKINQNMAFMLLTSTDDKEIRHVIVQEIWQTSSVHTMVLSGKSICIF